MLRAFWEGKLGLCGWTWEGIFHGAFTTLVYVSICERGFPSTPPLHLLWAHLLVLSLPPTLPLCCPELLHPSTSWSRLLFQVPFIPGCSSQGCGTHFESWPPGHQPLAHRKGHQAGVSHNWPGVRGHTLTRARCNGISGAWSFTKTVSLETRTRNTSRVPVPFCLDA